MRFFNQAKLLICVLTTVLLISLSTGILSADDEIKDAKNLQTIIVTASKAPIALEETASDVTVIDAEEIADKQYTSIGDALKSVPGLNVRSQGGYGSNTTVSMRGLHQKYTLILVDGVKVTDPTGMDRSSNIALMSTDNVERIEVVRGNQNTLHGTSAIGGVINIITKKAKKGDKLSGSVFSEFGSKHTMRYGGNFATATDKVNISMSVMRETSDNISNADINIDGVNENDEYRNTSFSTNIGLIPTDMLSFDFTARYNTGFYDYDAGAGLDEIVNEPENEENRDEFYGRAQTTISLFDNKWKQVAGVSYTSIKREGSNHWDDFVQTSYDKHYFWYGEVITVDYKNILELHETNTLTFGAETQEEICRYGNRGYYYNWNTFTAYNGDMHWPKTTVRSNSYFIEDQLRFWDKWYTTVGLRVDDHDTYHQHTTWKASTSYLIEKTGTRLKASYATGFYAPTLFNLYDIKFNGGNPGLNPEKSRGWEIGFDQNLWNDRITFGATFFDNRLSNQIVWGNNGYENRQKAKSNGIEVIASAEVTKKLSATASYTYTDSKQLEPTRDVAFQPNNKASFSLNYKFLDNLSAFTAVNYTGSCYNGDTTWRANDSRFQSYTLLDLGVNWDINKMLKLYGNCENVTDREYQERPGYGTFGRTFNIGMRASF